MDENTALNHVVEPEKKKRSFKEAVIFNFYDFASVMSAAVITIMLIFTFAFRFVGVVGTSMLPTLQHKDWLVISEMSRDVKYGDIIISTQPNAFNEPVVKRVIATEGQTVDINFSKGEVFVDGTLLNEPYINNPTTNESDVSFPLTVPEGCIFVMGDNRQFSSDSRSSSIGFIDEDYVLGVVKYRIIEQKENGTAGFVPFSEWKVH